MVNIIRYNVLLIEDDPSVVELMRCAAAEDSCPELDLTVVGGGDAVLAWLNDSVEKKIQMPHLILLDLKFPKLDGLAILRKLRLHPATRDVPIVAYSAEHTQADVVMSYQVGVNSFVAKPIDQKEFTAFLRDQLAHWLQPRQRELAFASK
ncbi:MAG TPA: response regulator [Gallionella sp.]|nr:response regulator [Gallionella sp.]